MADEHGRINMAEENKEEQKTTTGSTRKSRSTRSTRSTRSSGTSTRSTRSSRSPSSKTTTEVKKSASKKSSSTKKSWADKVVAKNKQIDKVLWSSRTFGGRLSSGLIKDIKKNLATKGPSSVASMHFLGTPRQRKDLARVLERILDA